jgi:UDP-glucose 4-epimerase
MQSGDSPPPVRRALDEIVIYGDGRQTRDFVHVRDAVSALIIALRYSNKSPPRSHAFNVFTGFGVSINQLARDIGAVLDRPMVIRYDAARPGDIRQSIGILVAREEPLNR